MQSNGYRFKLGRIYRNACLKAFSDRHFIYSIIFDKCIFLLRKAKKFAYLLTDFTLFFVPRKITMYSSPAALHLRTVRDVLRFAVSEFNRAGLFFGHGSDNAHDEAAYLILHSLDLPLDRLDPYLDAVLLPAERHDLLAKIQRRVTERLPVAYLTHQAWQGEFEFYVDERVIVPRSFIYELLGDGLRPWIEYDELVHRALDLCTGSGCLAVQMAYHYPDA